MWAYLNEFVSRLMGPVLRLISPLDPVWQGLLLGVPVAVLALVIYRVASNQAEITRTKAGIKANLLALRLFRDDLGVVIRTQGRVFRLVGRYLRLGLVPLAILLLPVLLLLAQIEAHHAYRVIGIGDPVHVTLTLDDSAIPTSTQASLQAPPAVRLQTPAFRLDAERLLKWRVSASEPGAHVLVIKVGDEKLFRQISVGGTRPAYLVPSTYRADDVHSVGSPGEEAIDSGSVVKEIWIDYQESEEMAAGLSSASWSMIISSLIFGMALRRPMRVDF